MSILRSMLVFGLLFGLVSAADAAKPAKAAKAAKKQAAAGTVRGVVKEVTPDKDNKDVGTLTIQTVAKKKKDAAAADAAPASETKKIVITQETKIEKVDAPAKGKKNEAPAAGTPAKFSDLQTNANVVVTLKTGTDTAEKVQIVAGGKKAKKAKNQ
jgi:hypothetical protein